MSGSVVMTELLLVLQGALWCAMPYLQLRRFGRVDRTNWGPVIWAILPISPLVPIGLVIHGVRRGQGGTRIVGAEETTPSGDSTPDR